MTVSLRILVPEETTNYVLNPQLRVNTTGWTANGSTISRTLNRARFGVASLMVVTNGAILNEGTFYRAKNLVGISDAITASVYVRGTGRVRLRLIDNPRGKEYRSKDLILTDERWKRIEVTGNCTGSDDIRIYIETSDTTPKATTFYVDGVQLERKQYSTTYCDGYQTGCRWNVTENNSLSTRSANTRLGGRWVPIAGPCRPDNDIYVTVLAGLGTPPLIISTQPFAEIPGSFVQGYKAQSRVIVFSFFVKKKNMRPQKPDLTRLHELRQQLLDIIKPDKTYLPATEIVFEYTENDTPIYFTANYEGGLEGEWDIRNEWVNSFPLRLYGANPILYEDDLEVSELDVQESFNPGAGSKLTMFGRENGVWRKTAATTGPNDNVLCVEIGPDGKVYAGGDFTGCDSVPGAVRIAYWDGSAWNAMGSGANAAIRAITFAANGDVYVAGDFTTIGGVACNRIAKWNGSAWSALSTGLSATCYTLCFARNGILYAGGDFLTAGGTTVNRIARWDGSLWRTVGTGTPGLNNTVRAIVNDVDGQTLFVGGSFTDGGASVSYFKSLDTTTNLFSSVTGSDEVYCLAVGYDGNVYAGGPLGVTQYNGAGWFDMGVTNGAVYSLDVGNGGEVYASGDFTTIGSLTSGRTVAQWNGGAWLNLNIIPNTPGTTRTQTIAFNPKNSDIYIGLFVTAASTTFVSGSTNVTNSGTTLAAPVLYFVGPGYLYYVGNRTTNAVIFLNLSLQNGEEVFIDTEKSIAYSLTRGTLFYGILPASRFGLFSLVPGVNIIDVLFYKDVGAKAYLSYVPQHWSMDAVGKPSDL